MTRPNFSEAKNVLYEWIHLTLPSLVICESLRLSNWLTERSRPNNVSSQPRILVLRLDHIGDLVISSAAIRELRRLNPDAHITLLVSSEAFAIAEACPHVDQVLSLAPGPTGLKFTPGRILKLLKFCRVHFSDKYDLALVTRWDSDRDFATVISWYSRAKRRVAFSERCSREKRLLNWGFDRYYTDVLSPGEIRHEVEKALDMVRHLGGIPLSTSTELWLTKADMDFAKRWWQSSGIGDSPVVMACALGAKKEKCRWPALEFARLIDELAGKHRIATLLICAPNEKHLAQEVLAQTKERVFFPSTSNVRQAAAIIARCNLLVGNNSAPIHLAAAAGIPVIEISCHPVNGDPADELNPLRFGAFSKDSVVVKAPQSIPPCSGKCNFWHQHCITAVRMEDVSEAVLNLLASRVGANMLPDISVIC